MDTQGPQGRQRLISRTVRVYLAAHDETHADLALVLGLSRPAVSQKLADRIRWTLPDLERLADHYGTAVDTFLRGDVLDRLGAVVEGAGSAPGGSRPRPARVHAAAS